MLKVCSRPLKSNCRKNFRRNFWPQRTFRQPYALGFQEHLRHQKRFHKHEDFVTDSVTENNMIFLNNLEPDARASWQPRQLRSFGRPALENGCFIPYENQDNLEIWRELQDCVQDDPVCLIDLDQTLLISSEYDIHFEKTLKTMQQQTSNKTQAIKWVEQEMVDFYQCHTSSILQYQQDTSETYWKLNMNVLEQATKFQKLHPNGKIFIWTARDITSSEQFVREVIREYEHLFDGIIFCRGTNQRKQHPVQALCRNEIQNMWVIDDKAGVLELVYHTLKKTHIPHRIIHVNGQDQVEIKFDLEDGISLTIA